MQEQLPKTAQPYVTIIYSTVIKKKFPCIINQ